MQGGHQVAQKFSTSSLPPKFGGGDGAAVIGLDGEVGRGVAHCDDVFRAMNGDDEDETRP